MAAAFQRRQIDGAVISALRVNAPMRMLVDLEEMDIQYSNVVIAVSRDFYRRYPQTVEAMVRAYIEGVAATHDQKERALKVIAKYTRLESQSRSRNFIMMPTNFWIECRGWKPKRSLPSSSLWGRNPSPSKPSLTIPSSTGWCAKALSRRFTRNVKQPRLWAGSGSFQPSCAIDHGDTILSRTDTIR